MPFPRIPAEPPRPTGDLAGAAGAPGALFHHRCAEQARRVPQRLAVVCEHETLTYGELEAAAERLARRLRALGVGPESRVAIFAPRSPRLIVALLGVLKAGGAYVPLDPAYPRQRLAGMLADSGAAVLLTETAVAERLPPHGLPTLLLDQGDRDGTPDGEEQAAPFADAAGGNLMYVLFTSGSTGRPKPVAVEHRQALHYLDAILDRLDLAGAGDGDGDGALSFATVSTFAADLGNTMLLPALASGGCLHIVTEERAADAAAMADYMSRHAIDCLKIVPSHLAALLAVDGSLRALPRRCLVIGGEAASPALLALLRAAAGSQLQVFNHYGPTETTVGVATRRLEPGGTGVLPLGRPLPNVRLHLLDERGDPAGAGEPGEIHVGGASVTRGYLGRPEATAERFVPDPWSPLPGRRLYRTGDLGRLDAAGDLEFLGRVDRQVKIRGFRVELGEIESVLRQHPGIADAAVTVASSASGEKRLVAHLVAGRPPLPALGELRELLANRLPEAMRPSILSFLQSLPLTPNGKLDRQALCEIQVDESESLGLPSARTPMEELVSTIWAGVLERGAVGGDEDFFTLGGHSLLAGQAVARLREALGLELPATLVFEHPTPARCAAEIEARQHAGARQLPALVPVPRGGGPLPSSYAQERLWLHDQLEPGSTAFNLGYSLRWRGRLAVPALDAGLATLLRRHEVLRTRLVAEHGVPLQWIDPAPETSGRHWPVADLSRLPLGERERCARAAVSDLQEAPFDLARGPLLRGALLRLAPDDHVLCLTVHHIAADGWSLGVLIRELVLLYGWFSSLPYTSRAAAPPLPGLAVQYADVAAWQRRWLQGDLLAEQLSYWRRQLGGDQPKATLPTDRPQSRAGGALEQIRREIPRELFAPLLELAREQGVTLFMILVSAVKLLLYRYTGRGRIVVGSMHANRTHSATEELIGFFVNVLPLETSLAPEWTFRELLGHVRATTLGAYAHHETPYEQILESVQPGRPGGRNALFQVMVLLQNMPVPELRLPGLEVEPFEPARATRRAAIDLTVTFAVESGRLLAWVGYDAGLFDPATAERFCDHLERVLADAGREPMQRLDGGGPLQLTERRLFDELPDDDVPESAVLEGAMARAATIRDQVAARRSQLSDKQLALLRRRLRQ